MKKTRKTSAPKKFSSKEAADSSKNSTLLTTNDRLRIGDIYNSKGPRNQALLEEVVFILKDKIAVANIKIHGIEGRIKTLDSVLEKCERKGNQDLESVVDIVGARVVCLFRSDMARVGELVLSNFDVVSVDDKISEGGPLGYMSIHYGCKMPSRYIGPRYENTGDTVFEIQIRTLCMHAWAAVSHYLDYKGDWDVPEDLKRALGALSGLFYVADSEFEQFYAARVQSRKDAEVQTSPEGEQEINLDTMISYLKQRFPDRRQSDTQLVSEIVHEVKAVGYTSIRELDRDIMRGLPAFLELEKRHPPSRDMLRYLAIGAVRVTLRLVSAKMRELEQNGAFEGDRSKYDATYRAVAHLIKSKQA